MKVSKRFTEVANRLRSRKGYLRILFSLSLILLLDIAFLLAAFTIANSTLRRELISSSQTYLEQTQSAFQSRIHDTQTMMIDLYLNPNIRYLQSKSDMSDDVYQVYTIKNELPDHTINSFIKGYFIYMHNSDTVLFNKAIYDAPVFYQYCYGEEALTFDEWSKMLCNLPRGFQILPSRSATFNQEPIQAVLCAFPLGYGFHSSGSVVAIIDEKDIQEVMGWSGQDEDSFTLITNGEGDVISQTDSFPPELLAQIEDGALRDHGDCMNCKIAGNNYIVFSHQSPEDNLCYYVARKEAAILSAAENLKVSFALVMAGLLILCLPIVVLLSRRSLVPLKKIIEKLPPQFQMLKEKDCAADEYDQILSGIQRLYADNEMLNIELTKQSHYYQESFLLKLCGDSFRSVEECQDYLKILGIDMDKGYCVACEVEILTFEDWKESTVTEMNVKRAILTATFKDEANIRQYQLDIDDNRVMMLLCLSEKNREKAQKMLGSYLQSHVDFIKHEYMLDVRVAVGSLCSRADELTKSFADARAVMRYECFDNPANLIVYRHAENASENPDYSEEKLEVVVTSGSAEDVDDALNRIFRENFVGSSSHLYARKLMLYNLLFMLTKMNNCLPKEEQIDLEAFYKFMENPTMSAVDLFWKIGSGFKAVNQMMTSRRERTNQKLFTEICEAIDEELHNSELCLAMISDRFNISISYLCQLFKTENGKTFAEYVEAMRMQLAKEMLDDPKKSIGAIAVDCGYNSPTAFGRAFKRVTGITPTDYRNCSK